MFYRFFYLIKNKTGSKYSKLKECPPSKKLFFQGVSSAITSKVSSSKDFEFLNLKKNFVKEVNWNFSEFGKLWTYNLNYFEFLHQTDLGNHEKIGLLSNFVKADNTLIDGIEPYPTSLRTINWIRYFSKQKDLDTSQFDTYLYSHVFFLSQRLEFHILGNHLLENAFALLMAGYYFSFPPFQKMATVLLLKQLEEQILNDGAHFERSPMYHKIIFYRVLEAMDLVKNNPLEGDEKIHVQLVKSATKMKSWLAEITFSNGDIPHVNDSTDSISLSSEALLKYADELGIETLNTELSDSGYRFWKQEGLELFMNIGGIGPSYQPGHAHADTLSFILYQNGKPLIVDTGTSTYEKDENRQRERSTSSHNTIAYKGLNSSEVWGGFRVGRRAKTKILSEDKTSIQVQNLGFKHLNIEHERSFEISNAKLVISDVMEGEKLENSKSYLHFHPSCKVELEGEQIIINDSLKIKLQGFDNLWLENYFFAKGFNLTTQSIKLCGEFSANTKMTFEKL